MLYRPFGKLGWSVSSIGMGTWNIGKQWGAIDDAKRVEIIRYTLEQLKQRGIGWLVYVLHHSLIADAHRPEFGILTDPGNLSFIEADGTLRPGHDVFNAF